MENNICYKPHKFLWWKWKTENHSFKPIYVEFQEFIKKEYTNQYGEKYYTYSDSFILDLKCENCILEKRLYAVSWNECLKFGISTEVLRQAKLFKLPIKT